MRAFTALRFYIMWERLQLSRKNYKYARICFMQKVRLVSMYPDAFENTINAKL